MSLNDRIYNKAVKDAAETANKPNYTNTVYPKATVKDMSKVPSGYLMTDDPYDKYSRISDFTVDYYPNIPNNFTLTGKFHTPESGTAYGSHSYTNKSIDAITMTTLARCPDVVTADTPDFSDFNSDSVIYFKPNGQNARRYYGTYGEMLKIAREGKDPYIKGFVDSFESVRQNMPNVPKQAVVNDRNQQLEQNTKKNIDTSGINFDNTDDYGFHY